MRSRDLGNYQEIPSSQGERKDEMSKSKKTAFCPSCSPRACFTADEEWNEEAATWVKTWKCNNCSHTLPRRVNKRHKRITPFKLKIIRKVLKLASDIVGDWGREPVRLSDPLRIQYLDSGIISFSFGMCPARAQTGSHLYMLTHKRFHLFIGTRGGVRHPGSGKTGVRNAVWDCIKDR